MNVQSERLASLCEELKLQCTIQLRRFDTLLQALAENRADAVIVHEEVSESGWQSVSLKPVSNCPLFRIRPPGYVTPEIVDYVRKRLMVPTRPSL